MGPATFQNYILSGKINAYSFRNTVSFYRARLDCNIKIKKNIRIDNTTGLIYLLEEVGHEVKSVEALRVVNGL
jgi:hypothetical protein